MQAYDVITQQEFLLKHGYLFWKDGEEAAKIIDISTSKQYPMNYVQIVAEIREGETIIMERNWTEHFNEVVIS
jgi:hypothetical protein